MYYIKKPIGKEEAVHIHVKHNKRVKIKDFENGVLNKTLLSLRQTEQMFNAKFRIITNDDKSKTKIFM